MPVESSASVKVRGLRELTKTLKELERAEDLAEVKEAFMAAAGEVVEAARARASTAQMRSAAGRLAVVKSQARAAVKIGGKPYDLGAEFGAFHGQRRKSARFQSGVTTGWNNLPVWAGRGASAGNFLYPAIRAQVPETIDKVGAAIERVFERIPNGVGD